MKRNSHHDQRLDQVLAEYMRREDAGDVDREAFLKEFPAYAAELAELLHAKDAVLRLAGPPVGNDTLGDGLASTQPLPIARQPSDTDTQALHVSEHSDQTQGKPDASYSVPSDKTKIEPTKFGNYELLEILGRGGMGVVYRARQAGLDRDVAVKMILNAQLAGEDDIQRFYIEARAAANIRHNHVVDIYEIGEFNSQHFFSMEWVKGTDLARLLREGRIESRRAARLMADIAEAVHAAHEQGVLHRDLKPANILIDEQDRVVVTDFGLAREFSCEAQERLTATGLAMGTPSYMSPEQASGKRKLMGPASDIYSLGAVLYAMLAGAPPHKGETVMDTLMSVIHQLPASPVLVNPNADPILCRICLKCLAKEPQDRYADAQELASDLRRFLDGQPVIAQELSQTQQVVRWINQLPIVAALRGRVVHHPTPGHLRVQAGMILFALFAVVAIASYPKITTLISNRMPSVVVIAGGQADGMYYQFARELALALNDGNTANMDRMVRESSGSGENREALLSRNAHLALIQESMVDSEDIAVIAPAFNELVHLIVRKGRVRTWNDLAGADIAIGPARSGMADTGAQVLQDSNARLVAEPAMALLENPELEGAIVTIGQGSEMIRQLLSDPALQLLPLPPDVIQRMTDDPRYRKAWVRAGLPEASPTVATPAFLVCRRDAPAVMVRQTLERLYPPIVPFQMPREEASHWNFIPLHAEARRFFNE